MDMYIGIFLFIKCCNWFQARQRCHALTCRAYPQGFFCITKLPWRNTALLLVPTEMSQRCCKHETTRSPLHGSVSCASAIPALGPAAMGNDRCGVHGAAPVRNRYGSNTSATDACALVLRAAMAGAGDTTRILCAGAVSIRH